MGIIELHKRRVLAPILPVINNTFIGGVSSVINTPALLAAKLLNYPSGTAFSASNIENFTIVGSNIECYISDNYELVPSAFSANTLITYYLDDSNYCKKSNGNMFKDAINLERFNLQGLINISQRDFANCPKIKQAIFPNCTSVSAGFAAFSSDVFHSSIKLESIYLPLCTYIGASVGNEESFRNINSTKKIYMHPSMATINAGGVEGDLVGHSISYVSNFIAPNPITDLTIGNVFATALQLNFTAPTGSTNAIAFYEVYNGTVYLGKITESGKYITGLTVNTLYANLQVKPVDIYYNKSTSNIISQTTLSALVYQDSLVSYYKMENNVLDNWVINNGTATSITYAAGLVGQSAGFNGTTSFIDLNSTSIIGGKSTFSLSIIFKYGGKANSVLYGSWSTGLEKIIVRINTGQIQFYTKTSAIVGGSFVAFTDTSSYHILICTYDGTTMRVYLDNVLSGTTYAQTGIIGSGGETEKIGKERTTVADGRMDDVSIFNKALTVGEVSEINAKLNSGQSLI